MSRGHMAYARAWMPDKLPCLANYEKALAYHNSVKPYAKGAAKGKRPLGKNRAYSRSLIAIGEQGSVDIKLHGTTIVSYKQDGSVVFDSGNWDSMLTAQAMQEVHGITTGGGIQRHRGKLYLVVKSGSHLLSPSVTLCPDGTVIGGGAEVKYALDKPAFAELISRFKPFTDYVRQILTLTRGLPIDAYKYKEYSIACGHNVEAYSFSLRYHTNNSSYYAEQSQASRVAFFSYLNRCLAMPDGEERLEAMYPAALLFVWGSAYDGVHNPKVADKLFRENLKLHFAKSVFREVEVPAGTIAPSTNLKYVRQRTV